MGILRRRPLEGALDVVGLGALNVDLIVVGPDSDDPDEDAEKLARPEEILARLARRDIWPDGFLGGSAFNAMVMLAQLELGLRLGMVGMAAAPAYGMRESHGQRLEDLDIRDLTFRSEGRPGLCLALSNERRRRLLTSPACNVEIVDHLDSSPRHHVAVASARILHLTSLLEDPAWPGSTWVAKRVSSFVESVKDLNPGLQLSFDPGATWVDGVAALQETHRLYELADVLFVNAEEHATLRAEGVVKDPRSSGTTIVEKLPDKVVVHGTDDSAESIGRADIGAVAVDPLGAGDALAAGVLAALGCGRSIADGCRLGLRIAAHRVRAIGDRGHAELKRSIGRRAWR